MRRKSVAVLGMEVEWEEEDKENQWKANFEGFWVRVVEEGLKEVRNDHNHDQISAFQSNDCF